MQNAMRGEVLSRVGNYRGLMTMNPNDLEAISMIALARLTVIAALMFMALRPANADLPKPRLWNCESGGIVVINPNDPIWKQDKAVFFKGTLRLTFWNGQSDRQLTYEQSAKAPNAPCVRQPLLDGYTLRSVYFLQDLSLPLVL
jgi:hypothetical protein